MGKKTTKSNHRVEVYPDAWPDITHDYLMGKLEDLKRSIMRHIDGVEVVVMNFDHEHTCEHCGSYWTEESNAYNGGCCDKDEEANPEGK